MCFVLHPAVLSICFFLCWILCIVILKLAAENVAIDYKMNIASNHLHLYCDMQIYIAVRSWFKEMKFVWLSTLVLISRQRMMTTSQCTSVHMMPHKIALAFLENRLWHSQVAVLIAFVA